MFFLSKNLNEENEDYKHKLRFFVRIQDKFLDLPFFLSNLDLLSHGIHGRLR